MTGATEPPTYLPHALLQPHGRTNLTGLWQALRLTLQGSSDYTNMQKHQCSQSPMCPNLLF
jgi:hypothetical protein